MRCGYTRFPCRGPGRVQLRRVASIPTCDVTAPTVTVESPVNGTTYVVGQLVDTVFTCTDPELRTREGNRLDGQAVDTTRVGTYSVEVFADDNAGNATEAVVTYTVAASAPLTVVTSSGTTALMSALAEVTVFDHDRDPATADQPALVVADSTGNTTTISGCAVPTPATEADAALFLAGQPYRSRTGPAPVAPPPCRPSAVTTTQSP